MSWDHYQLIDFTDEAINTYHIDTRDFHCHTNDFKPELDMHKVDKHPDRFYHTPQEVKLLLNRLYEESGGEGEWRMLTLEGDAVFRTQNWQMKYIRIYRRPEGLLVGIADGLPRENSFIMSKSMLSNKVNQKYLNHH